MVVVTFDPMHVFVGEAKVVADLVDDDVADEMAELDATFSPLREDGNPVEEDHRRLARH